MHVCDCNPSAGTAAYGEPGPDTVRSAGGVGGGVDGDGGKLAATADGPPGGTAICS